MAEREYRFTFSIVDAVTNEVVDCDWCSLVDRDTDRNERIDTHVYQMLRNWRKFAREEYEATLDTPANEYVLDDAQFGVGA